MLSLKKYDIKVNESIYLDEFYIEAGLLQDRYHTYCVWDTVTWNPCHTNTNTYICGLMSEENMTLYFLLLKIPNCVNVTSEVEASRLVRCISLNHAKSLYCFMSVAGVEALLRKISVVSLCYCQIFTSTFNLKRKELRPLRYSSKQWTMQRHTERWNLQEHNRGNLPAVMMIDSLL